MTIEEFFNKIQERVDYEYHRLKNKGIDCYDRIYIEGIQFVVKTMCEVYRGYSDNKQEYPQTAEEKVARILKENTNDD